MVSERKRKPKNKEGKEAISKYTQKRLLVVIISLEMFEIKFTRLQNNNI